MAHVIIIEDEPTIAMVIKEVLADEGHAVVTASDGPSGLSALRQAPRPDVVLVDLFMPGLSGRAVVEAMRADPALRAVPVVIVTGAVTGAGEFPPPGTYEAVITKPFDVADVVRIVDRLVPAPQA